jgi:ribose 1,5-bisphosphokinase
MHKGDAKLYYLVGSSGSGKDSVLSYFREYLASQCQQPVVIAHRYITRITDSSENAISLTEAEFEQRVNQGMFAMHWHANGLYYGIGIEVSAWLEKGVSVILNGSREYLPQAKNIYGDCFHSIAIQVSDSIIESRLRQRNREDDPQIQQRLERHKRLQSECETDSVIINESSIKQASQHLFQIINS